MSDIMIDVDDVLADWFGEVHRRCHAAGLAQTPEPLPEAQWSMWLDYGASREEWEEVISIATLEGMYQNMPTLPGAAKAMRDLRWGGHTIHIVTARGFMAHGSEIREWTRDWLAEQAIPYDTLTFTKDKVAAQDALGVRFDAALDDGWHNYQALTAASVPTFLVDAPHNRRNYTALRVPSLAWWVNSDIIQHVQHASTKEAV